jgi:enoyl-CoA hydratase/carnithine racemase
MGSSTAQQALLTSLEEGILTLTLNRPDRRNAVDPELRDALAAALERAATDPAVRGVVLTGAGGTFCAGGDLGRFDELYDARAYRHVAHRLTDLAESLERLEKPVVAAIDGVVTGAGLALALACDWRVGSPSARILFREGRLGLVPTHGGLTRLVKLIGLARAPLSFAAAKRLLQLAADADQRSAVLAESFAQAALLQSEDHREGLAAARERRDPEFHGC